MKNIKKILYVRNGPYIVNPKLYNLQEIGFCRALCKMGFDCDIIYYSKENKDEIIFKHDNNRVKIIWRKGYKILRTGLYPSLLRKEFVNNYDLIITTEYSQIMSLFWTYFKPKVVLYNGPYYNMFKIPIFEGIYDKTIVPILKSRVDKVFTKSKLASLYLEEKGFKNSVALGVGLNTSVFEKTEKLPLELNLPLEIIKKNKSLLYVGSLEERKNSSFLLNLFEDINKERPDIKLIIIGDGKKVFTDKIFKRLDEKTKENIIHLKKVDNKYLGEFYRNSDLFLLPSIKEIFGMVLLEAMAFGSACITSLHGGSSTLIESDKDGIIIKDFDINTWKKAILSLIDDEKKKDDISLKAMEKINANYNWDYIANDFIEEINKIM